jgi:hypothetical protein
MIGLVRTSILSLVLAAGSIGVAQAADGQPAHVYSLGTV